jgi:hypothetical protein
MRRTYLVRSIEIFPSDVVPGEAVLSEVVLSFGELGVMFVTRQSSLTH